MRPIIGSVALTLLSACASLKGSSSLPDLRVESNAYSIAARFKSADSISRFFADNVVVMSPQGRQPVRGKAANREAWQRFFSGVNPEHTMTTDSVVIDPGGLMGYSLGQWTVGVDTPTGRASAQGHYLAVWQRQGGRWLISAITAYPFR